MKRELTCIGCPMGCRLTAEFNGTEVTEVTGNGCAVGARYAREELTNPKRMVTALVRVVGMERPLSVKTEAPIEKRLVFDCLAALGAVAVAPPVRIGDVILENVLGTGVNVVATEDIGS